MILPDVFAILPDVFAILPDVFAILPDVGCEYYLEQFPHTVTPPIARQPKTTT